MSLNVLIVDDSSVVRSMIAKTLRLAGLPIEEVHEAGNGQEGLEAMEAHWIDLILADIHMPVMDGEVMIERLRANPVWSDLPIVVISAEGSQQRVERLRGMGVRFIHKPFTPEKVRQVVTEMLGVCNEQSST
jgi:two-component system chemotaxis response regulator CheY